MADTKESIWIGFTAAAPKGKVSCALCFDVLDAIPKPLWLFVYRAGDHRAICRSCAREFAPTLHKLLRESGYLSDRPTLGRSTRPVADRYLPIAEYAQPLEATDLAIEEITADETKT